MFYSRNRTIRPGTFRALLSPPRLGCVDPVQSWEAAQEDVTETDQSGALHSVSGVAETQREIRSPLIAHCRPGRCFAKAGWFMNSSASLPGVPRAFVYVCFSYMQSVGFNILLAVPLEHD